MSNRKIVSKYIGIAKIDEIIPHNNRNQVNKGPDGLNIRGSQYVDDKLSVRTEYPNNAFHVNNGGITITGNDSILNTILFNVSNTSNLNTLVIKNNGRIGIGTDNPSTILEIQGKDALRIPVGNTNNRPINPKLGYIRFNTEQNSFEGFGAGNEWGTLGGTIDIDKDTRIDVESNLEVNINNPNYNTDFNITLGTNNNLKSNLFDNNLNTNWTSSSTNDFIIFDLLNDKKKLTEIKLYTLSLNSDSNLSKVKLQSSSDNITYNDIPNSQITITQTNSTLIPLFTSNTTPTQIYTDYLSGFTSERLYKVFDNSDSATDSPAYFQRTSGNNIVNRYVGYNFGTKTCVTKYLVQTAWNGAQNDTLKKWMFQGSHDGINWITLDSQDNYTNTVWLTLDNFTKIIELPNPVNYIHYRWFIQENNGHPYCGVASLKIFTYNWENANSQTQNSITQNYISYNSFNKINARYYKLIIDSAINSASNPGTSLLSINYQQNEDDDTIRFYTRNNQRLMISNNGNVGFGLGFNKPSVSLHVNASDAIKIPKGTTSERPEYLEQGLIRYNTETDQFEGYGAGNAWGSLGSIKDVDRDTYISSELTANADNDEIKFFTEGVERMIISNSVNSGYIGIGTINPQYTLHVNASDAIKIPIGTSSERPTYLQKGLIRYNSETDQFEGYGAGNAWGSLGGIKDVDRDTYISSELTANADNDEIKFFTEGVERMIISNSVNSGYIGIGTINPQAVLDIRGNLAVSGNAYFNNGIILGNSVYASEGAIRYIGDPNNATKNEMQTYVNGQWRSITSKSFVAEDRLHFENTFYIKFITQTYADLLTSRSLPAINATNLNSYYTQNKLYLNNYIEIHGFDIILFNNENINTKNYVVKFLINDIEQELTLQNETEFSFDIPNNKSDGLKTLNFSFGRVLKGSPDDHISLKIKSTNTTSSECIFHLRGLQSPNERYSIEYHSDVTYHSNVNYSSSVIIANTNTLAQSVDGCIRFTGSNYEAFVDGGWKSLIERTLAPEQVASAIQSDNWFINNIDNTYKNFLFTTNIMPRHLSSSSVTNDYFYIYRTLVYTHINFLFVSSDTTNSKEFSIKMLIDDEVKNIGLDYHPHQWFTVPSKFFDGYSMFPLKISQPVVAKAGSKLKLQIKCTNGYSNIQCSMHFTGHSDSSYKTPQLLDTDIFITKNLDVSSNVNFSGNGVGLYNGGVSWVPEINTLEVHGHVQIFGNMLASGLIMSTSDRNLKKNIEPLDKGINVINELQPKSYLWKDNNLNTPNKKTFGFIAQEVNEIIPDIVHKQEEYYNIEYNSLTAILTKSIQELSNKVDDIDNKLNSKVDYLDKKINTMDKKIQKIEKNEKNNNLFKLF